MDQRRLAQDSAYAVPRIERGEGILENQLRRQHRLCAIAPRHCVDPPPLEMNFTLARFDQTRHQARERRLSATALPDDSAHLASPAAEGDIVEIGRASYREREGQKVYN